ncbi:TPA: ankyrin repeat domain-containing protein [Vibrio alginolyticus]
MISNKLSDYSGNCTNEFEDACAIGDLKAIKSFVRSKRYSVLTVNQFTGASPLHFAAQSGNIFVFEYILKCGAHINQQAPINGMTPLMVSVWHKHIELTAFILRQPGVNIEILSHYGLSARDLSSFGFKQPFDTHAKSVINEFDSLFEEYVNARDLIEQRSLFSILLSDMSDFEKATAIEKGLKLGEINAAELNMPLPHKCNGNDAHTPLLLASRDGLSQTVKVLLHYGADQTIVDVYMRSLPIHKAAFSGHADVLAELLSDEKAEQVIDAQGPFNGYTPLHDAVWNGHDASVDKLTQAQCRCDLKGHDGYTPIDFAHRLNRTNMLEVLEKYRN